MMSTALESSAESAHMLQSGDGEDAGDDVASRAWMGPLLECGAPAHPLASLSGAVCGPPAQGSAFEDAAFDSLLVPRMLVEEEEEEEPRVAVINPGDAFVLPAIPVEGVDPVVPICESFTPLVPRPDSVCTSVAHGCPTDMIDLDLTAEGSVKPSGSSSLHSVDMHPSSLRFLDSDIETL